MASIGIFLMILAFVCTIYLILSYLKSEKKFFVALFMLKPFIDQTVHFKIISFGGTDITFLSLWGVLVFIVVATIYFLKILNLKKRIYAQGLIWLMLLIHIMSALIASNKGKVGFINAFEMLIRISGPYLFYFVFILYYTDKQFIYSLFKAIWLGNLYAMLFSIAVHVLGIGYADISQGVIRFSGFYGDSATLSLTAFSAIAFAILYKEVNGSRLSKKMQYQFYLTLLAFAYIFWLTLTKATILITIALFFLWYGYYKKRKVIIFPIIILGIFFFFRESQSVRARFFTEINFMQTVGKEKIDINSMRGMGSGRVGRWVDTLKIYENDYSFFEKLFGTYLFYKSHSQYLGFLMQIGLIGLIVFIAVVLLLLRGMLVVFKKSRDPIIFMGIILFICILLYGIGYQSFTYTGFLWLTFILISPINIMKTRKLFNSNRNSISKK